MEYKYARKYTVTFYDEISTQYFYTEMFSRHMCKIEMISNTEVFMYGDDVTYCFLQDIWNCICSDEVDCPDKILNIKIENYSN